jgi:hypothetical protein
MTGAHTASASVVGVARFLPEVMPSRRAGEAGSMAFRLPASANFAASLCRDGYWQLRWQPQAGAALDLAEFRNQFARVTGNMPEDRLALG